MGEEDRSPTTLGENEGTARARPRERIRELVAAADAAREGFDPPATPDEERATTLLREGFGPTVWVYVEGRTGGRRERFSETEMLLLRQAMNDWLRLYARCYGVDLDARFTVREAAEMLVETRNVRDTAELLTRVPER
jgi:hypothetical protein